MVSSSTQARPFRSRILSPALILLTAGTIVGYFIGLGLMYVATQLPYFSSIGVLFIGLAVGQISCAYLGSKLVREALWKILLMGQSLGFAGFCLLIAGFFVA